MIPYWSPLACPVHVPLLHHNHLLARLLKYFRTEIFYHLLARFLGIYKCFMN